MLGVQVNKNKINPRAPYFLYWSVQEFTWI